MKQKTKLPRHWSQPWPWQGPALQAIGLRRSATQQGWEKIWNFGRHDETQLHKITKLIQVDCGRLLMLNYVKGSRLLKYQKSWVTLLPASKKNRDDRYETNCPDQVVVNYLLLLPVQKGDPKSNLPWKLKNGFWREANSWNHPELPALDQVMAHGHGQTVFNGIWHVDGTLKKNRPRLKQFGSIWRCWDMPVKRPNMLSSAPTTSSFECPITPCETKNTWDVKTNKQNPKASHEHSTYVTAKLEGTSILA